MKNIFFSLISIAAFAVVFSACKKQDNVAPASGNSATHRVSSFSSGEECDSCCVGLQLDSIQGGPVDEGDVGDPLSWGSKSYAFCGGEDKVDFLSQFNSVIQGKNNWKVGYLNEVNVSYSTPLCSLTCEDVLPNIIPTANNRIGSNTFSPGYYKYVPNFEIFRLVAVWQCCPEDSTIKIYVVKVLDLQANPVGTDWFSNVIFEYKCFQCPLTGACPDTPASRSTYREEVLNEVPESLIRYKK